MFHHNFYNFENQRSSFSLKLGQRTLELDFYIEQYSSLCMILSKNQNGSNLPLRCVRYLSFFGGLSFVTFTRLTVRDDSFISGIIRGINVSTAFSNFSSFFLFVFSFLLDMFSLLYFLDHFSFFLSVYVHFMKSLLQSSSFSSANHFFKFHKRFEQTV